MLVGSRVIDLTKHIRSSSRSEEKTKHHRSRSEEKTKHHRSTSEGRMRRFSKSHRMRCEERTRKFLLLDRARREVQTRRFSKLNEKGSIWKGSVGWLFGCLFFCGPFLPEPTK
jgi:hypothetical protein